MKSRLLIGLLSFALGLQTALLVVTFIKVDRLDRLLEARGAGRGARPQDGAPEAARGANRESDREGDREGDRAPERFMLWGLPQVDPARLGLSEEQKTRIGELRAEWKKEEMARREALLERREQMPDLFEDDKVTMEELLPFLDQAHEESKARMETLLRYYRSYQEILTPEQQEAFKRMIREQRERHHAMRREARMRIEQFREMREGGEGPGAEGRPRGERLRRLLPGEGPERETSFAPGMPEMPPGMPEMPPGMPEMPPSGPGMPPGGPGMGEFPPTGEMPAGPVSSGFDVEPSGPMH